VSDTDTGMQFQKDSLYHIYNRGNDKQQIFFSDNNYQFFLEKMQRYVQPNCDILAWCLMPNHFHMLIRANELTCELSKTVPLPVFKLADNLGLLLSSYTKAINKQQATSGSLFQQRTKSKLVADDTGNYSLTAFHYIHQNPLKAGLVERLENWRFSSFREYAGLKKGGICNKELAIELLNLNQATFVSDSYNALRDDMVRGIF
jgi:putative transposase